MGKATTRLTTDALAFLTERHLAMLTTLRGDNSPHVVAVACGILGATFGRIEEPFKPGLRFCAKKVLRAGIVLLGFRLSLSELGKLGPRALVAVVARPSVVPAPAPPAPPPAPPPRTWSASTNKNTV